MAVVHRAIRIACVRKAPVAGLGVLNPTMGLNIRLDSHPESGIDRIVSSGTSVSEGPGVTGA